MSIAAAMMAKGVEIDDAVSLNQGQCFSGEVNALGVERVEERLLSVDLAHGDLAGRQQRPEQHRGGFGRWQHGLRPDAPLERLLQPLDRTGRTRRVPSAFGQAAEGEPIRPCLLQAVGNGAACQAPFAQKGAPLGLDFLGRRAAACVVAIA